MGRDNSITRVRQFGPALRDIKALRRLSLAFRENDRDLPFGWQITSPEWDNNYLRSHQEPRTPEPSSPLSAVVPTSSSRLHCASGAPSPLGEGLGVRTPQRA